MCEHNLAAQHEFAGLTVTGQWALRGRQKQITCCNPAVFLEDQVDTYSIFLAQIQVFFCACFLFSVTILIFVLLHGFKLLLLHSSESISVMQ